MCLGGTPAVSNGKRLALNFLRGGENFVQAAPEETLLPLDFALSDDVGDTQKKRFDWLQYLRPPVD